MTEDADQGRTPFGAFLRSVGDELAGASRQQPLRERPARRVRSLFTGVMPIPEQSLRGMVAEACRTNFLPNSWGLLKDLGLAHRNRVMVSEDPNIDPAELATAMRVPTSEVSARRYEKARNGQVSFFGLVISARRIEPRVRRFSPTAFLSSNHHRAIWELRDIPFCLQSWDMLQDRCHCETPSVVQGWTRTLTHVHECDRCGDPLKWLDPVPVPAEMQEALGALKAIVLPNPAERASAGKHLPEALRTADRSALFGLISRLAKAIDPSAEHEPFDSPAERLGALHQACRSIRQWPDGLATVPWHHQTKRGTIIALQAAWRALAPLPQKPATVPPGCKRVAPERRLQNRQVNEARAAKPVGIRPATTIARLSPEILLAAWEHNLLTQHHRFHGARKLPGFDPDQLTRFALSWSGRLAAETVATLFGISYHGVEQLLAMKIIEADAPALPGTGPFCASDSIDAFVSRLLMRAVDHVPDPISLLQAISTISGRAKPWGPVVGMVQGGHLSFSTAKGASLSERIHISRNDLPRLSTATFSRADYPTSTFRTTMVQRDALEMLNVSATAVRLLSDIPFTGTNPKLYEVEAVERLAGKIVTMPDIARAMDLCPAKAFHEARRLGFSELAPGAWDRSILAKLA